MPRRNWSPLLVFIQRKQCFLEKGNPYNAEGVIYSNLTDKIMQDWDEIKWDGDEIKHWLLPFIQLQHSFFVFFKNCSDFNINPLIILLQMD